MGFSYKYHKRRNDVRSSISLVGVPLVTLKLMFPLIQNVRLYNSKDINGDTFDDGEHQL